ncbi:MAG: hypothetical protein JWR22_513 [Herminiimonas sp.]|nr:hypothetical protein [Herminiimonas sp.]
MRSTRASAAVDRLKRRSEDAHYSMSLEANGLIRLAHTAEDGTLEMLSAALEQDEFVRFVNAFGPQTPQRVSKLDVAFEKQLKPRKD